MFPQKKKLLTRSKFYTTPERDSGYCEKLENFLGEHTQPLNFIYKDVVQPFVVSKWLPSRNFKVIKIKRELTDVVFSMYRKQWFYPGNGVSPRPDRLDALIEGLLLAEYRLAGLAGVELDFERLVNDEMYLSDQLAELYPGSRLTQQTAYQRHIMDNRQNHLADKTSDAYLSLAEKVAQARQAFLLTDPKEGAPPA